jgi:hypothetical protein
MMRRTVKRTHAHRITQKGRKSPTVSATVVTEGTVQRGNDGQDWVSVRGATGVQRWVPVISATLHGLRRLTVDDVARAFRTGKELVFYERGGGESTWPSSVRGMGRTIFRPNGDLLVGPPARSQKRHSGWLRTRTPAIHNRMFCLLDGQIVFNPGSKHQMKVAGGVQIDSLNKKLVSSNIMNMESFVLA